MNHLLTREPEPQTWAEVLGEHYIASKREEPQELEARTLGVGTVSAVKRMFNDRDVSDDIINSAALNHLLTRQPEPYLGAPVISIGRPDFYQTRDLADDIGTFGINDLFTREPTPWLTEW